MNGLTFFLIGWVAGQLFLFVALLKFNGKNKNDIDNKLLSFNRYLERIPPDFITWTRPY